MKTYPHMVPQLSPQELEAFYPASEPGRQGNGKWAERRLYEVMDKFLPQDWVVVCNTFVEVKTIQFGSTNGRLPIIGPGGRSFHENQLDFLVFVPHMGVVNVDAKGGTYAINGLNECRAKNIPMPERGGADYVVMCSGHPGKNVFDQAKNAIHTVDEFIRQEVLHLRRGERWGNYGDLVTFVGEDFRDSARPKGVEYATYTDLSGAAEGLKAKIIGVLEKHKYAPSDASEQFDKYMEKILDEFARVAQEGVNYSNEYQIVDWVAGSALGNEQLAVFNEIRRMDARYCHVTAGAGTGKTVLARRLAEHFAEQGQRVLYVCYNKKLAEVLQTEWLDPARNRGVLQHVQVSAFHGLPKVMLANTKERKQNFILTNVTGFDRRATDNVMARTFSEACRRAGVALPDVIVVDEAQDLSRDAVKCLGRLLKPKSTSRMIFFSDSGQMIYRQGDDWTVDQLRELCAGIVEPKYRLDRNYRNTDVIVDEFSRHVDSGVQPRIMEGFVEVNGKPFVPKEVTNVEAAPTSCDDAVLARLRGLLNDGKSKRQVAVLAFHEASLAKLKSCVCKDGSRVVLGPELSKWRANATVLKSSVQGFKGLESDSVILIDDLEYDGENADKLRYVAKSRAKYELIVVRIQKGPSETIEERRF